jgi:hypothetical protein
MHRLAWHPSAAPWPPPPPPSPQALRSSLPHSRLAGSFSWWVAGCLHCTAGSFSVPVLLGCPCSFGYAAKLLLLLFPPCCRCCRLAAAAQHRAARKAPPGDRFNIYAIPNHTSNEVLRMNLYVWTDEGRRNSAHLHPAPASRLTPPLLAAPITSLLLLHPPSLHACRTWLPQQRR